MVFKFFWFVNIFLFLVIFGSDIMGMKFLNVFLFVKFIMVKLLKLIFLGFLINMFKGYVGFVEF